MKKSLLHHLIVMLVFCFLFLLTVKANAQWRLIGLENDTILSIAKDKFTDDGVIVGTKSSGIKIYNNGWLDISAITLPVNDIFVTSSLTFIAAIGYGSNSDGFYRADAIDGPPYYVLGSMPFYGMMFPQSVTGIENGDTIYMGGGNLIVSGIIDSSNSNYSKFPEIKIPISAFGVENPKCAALHILSEYNQLYAGGYDESPEPGPGHLLWMLGDKDSLAINSQLNVSSITEGVKETGGLHLYASTIDSGIYYRIGLMSMPIAKFAPSPNNERVNDMLAIDDTAIANNTLCVAVKSGVFAYIDSAWSEIGNIPAEPLCLTGYVKDGDVPKYLLYAGTQKGVYEINLTGVSIKYQPVYNFINGLSIQYHNGRTIVISFQLTKSENLSIDIYNSSGRRITRITNKYFSSGTHRIAVNVRDMNNKKVSSGVYFLRLSTEKEQVNKRFLIF